MPNFRDNARRPPKHYLVTVFQALNHTRKEALLGFTDVLLPQLVEMHREKPPKIVRHWTRRQRVEYRSLAHAIPHSDAETFIKAHLKADALKGWKILRNK